MRKQEIICRFAAYYGCLIDANRESISRFLGEFDKDGIISLNGKQITILNKRMLQLVSANG